MGVMSCKPKNYEYFQGFNRKSEHNEERHGRHKKKNNKKRSFRP